MQYQSYKLNVRPAPFHAEREGYMEKTIAEKGILWKVGNASCEWGWLGVVPGRSLVPCIACARRWMGKWNWWRAASRKATKRRCARARNCISRPSAATPRIKKWQPPKPRCRLLLSQFLVRHHQEVLQVLDDDLSYLPHFARTEQLPGMAHQWMSGVVVRQGEYQL